MQELELKKTKSIPKKKQVDEKQPEIVADTNSSTTKTIKKDKYQVLKDLKIITAIGETILAIPVLGGFIVLSTLWIPLFIMIGLHIGAIVYSNQNQDLGFSNTNHILGIIFNVVGFIPFIGMILHIILAILLWIEYNSIVEQEQK